MARNCRLTASPSAFPRRSTPGSRWTIPSISPAGRRPTSTARAGSPPSPTNTAARASGRAADPEQGRSLQMNDVTMDDTAQAADTTLPGPLDGVRVVDWTIWQQGPVAGAMLGDLG